MHVFSSFSIFHHTHSHRPHATCHKSNVTVCLLHETHIFLSPHTHTHTHTHLSLSLTLSLSLSLNLCVATCVSQTARKRDGCSCVAELRILPLTCTASSSSASASASLVAAVLGQVFECDRADQADDIMKFFAAAREMRLAAHTVVAV
jgi:hypothetical protein